MLTLCVVVLFDHFDHQIGDFLVERFGLNADGVLKSSYEFIRQVAVMMNRKHHVT